jgi:hypothetical protein
MPSSLAALDAIAGKQRPRRRIRYDNPLRLASSYQQNKRTTIVFLCVVHKVEVTINRWQMAA